MTNISPNIPQKYTTHLIFWLFVVVVFGLTLNMFKPVLLPFVLGIAVAYLLNPVVGWLAKVGIPRAPATLMILFGFLIMVLAAIGIITPILYREFSIFANELPTYLERLWNILGPFTAQLDQYVSGEEGKKIEDILKENAATAVKTADFILKKLAAGGQAVMDVVSVTLFMPIVAYFMMKEWPSITRWVQDLIPRHSEETIMNLLKEIDAKISGFVRGQITVAVILGVTYAIALTIAGLKYGFLIGLMSGMLSVIPMVGSAIGLVISVAVAWFQTGDLMFVGIIAAIFIAGQLIEGNFLTPKLVGDSVGLHPLWVFFALLAGGSLLGILGMFLAVPVAAVIGVLLSFALYKYKESAYYGASDKAQEDQTEKTASKGK